MKRILFSILLLVNFYSLPMEQKIIDDRKMASLLDALLTDNGHNDEQAKRFTFPDYENDQIKYSCTSQMVEAIVDEIDALVHVGTTEPQRKLFETASNAFDRDASRLTSDDLVLIQIARLGEVLNNQGSLPNKRLRDLIEDQIANQKIKNK